LELTVNFLILFLPGDTCQTVLSKLLYYTWAASTLITIFSKMLKISKNCPNIQDEPGSDVHPTLEIITLGAVNHLVNGIALEISK
jgi:hypothetical protein